MKNSRFLKRGEGVGGGKAMLEVKSGHGERGNVSNISKVGGNGKKDRYEVMLENCLAKCEWEKDENNPDIME